MALSNADFRALVQRAEQAINAGSRAEAKRLTGEVLAASPDHALALNVAGMFALSGGNYDEALRQFTASTARDASNASVWINQATALRHLDRLDEEERALDRALALEPRNILALLQKGYLYELRDDLKKAATTFTQALQSVPPGARIPDAMKTFMQHAIEIVNKNDAELAAFLENAVRDVRSKHVDEDQSRFDQAIGRLVGKAQIYTPQPTFLYFPKLPPLEFYPRSDYPWLSAFEAATEEIAAEFQRVYAGSQTELKPYIAYGDGAPIDQWKDLNHSPRWSAYFLWKDGKPVDSHIAQCPRTAALLSQAPMLDLPGYGPSAFFSVLEPHTRIPAHTGVTNSRLIVHVPLVIPPGCGFRVGSETREWRPGHAWVFDDSIEHEAWNDSDQVRAILIFDIWNSFMTAAERDMTRAAVRGVRDYYGWDEKPASAS